jgi:hypothetical protein
MSPVNRLTVKPNNLAPHRHFSSSSQWVLEGWGFREVAVLTPLAQKASSVSAAQLTRQWHRHSCLCWHFTWFSITNSNPSYLPGVPVLPGFGKKRTNMKVSPTMLLIINDGIFYPTMCMINKVVISPVPRC